MLKDTGLTAIEGYDKLPTLYTSYVASSITDMQGNAYTPSQIWMEYKPSSLIDANGADSANDDVFEGGEWKSVVGESTDAIEYNGTLYETGEIVAMIGTGHSSKTLYRGNGGSIVSVGSTVTPQGNRADLPVYIASTNGGYRKSTTTEFTRYYGGNGTAYNAGTSYVSRGSEVNAIEYDGTLYEKGYNVTVVGKGHASGTLYKAGSTTVRACGPKVTYTASSASPRLYNASSATNVKLKLAALSTETATVLKYGTKVDS